MSDLVNRLVELSQDLGRESRRLAILGEGNTSVRSGPDTFLIKASGSSLATLSAGDVTECRMTPLLELLEQPSATDAEVAATLLASRTSPDAKRPSTEAFFHAYLLSLAGIEWIAHTHPIAVNGVLCSPRAQLFAERRMFPDEIVCCGQRSVIIPYTDPGLTLARTLKSAVDAAVEDAGAVPRVILLTNHGLITPASSAAGAMAATLMTVKAAEIFSIASALGGPVFLEPNEVSRIEGRDDEHYRRQQLKL